MTQFRLQRVLDHRKRREDELHLRLAAATAERLRKEQQLTDMLTEEHVRRDALGALLSGGRVDAGEVQSLGWTLDAYGRSIAALREVVAKSVVFEEEERIRLQSASVERKALDKVRDHHVERERHEEKRKEGSLLDEIATSRAARVRMTAALNHGGD